MSISNNLFSVAYLGSKDIWYEKLDLLSNLALSEKWTYENPDEKASNKRTPILENYVLHTYRRLAYEFNHASSEDEKKKIFFISGNKFCFNTGLFTKQYEPIYACFKHNRSKGHEPWYLTSFSDTSDPFFENVLELPRRARYFSQIKELIYDTSAELRVNSAHILSNPNNRKRLPPELSDSPFLVTLFDGAVKLALKKVEANYKAAVPQFYDDQICFLLPICLRDPAKADLSLAVRWHEGYYTGHTCLTLDMAYNNARLIACPNSEWLHP